MQERYADCNILERVMARAGISYNLKTKLVILDGTLAGQCYINQVINPHCAVYAT